MNRCKHLKQYWWKINILILALTHTFHGEVWVKGLLYWLMMIDDNWWLNMLEFRFWWEMIWKFLSFCLNWNTVWSKKKDKKLSHVKLVINGLSVLTLYSNCCQGWNIWNPLILNAITFFDIISQYLKPSFLLRIA